jgi:hypothetical protein
MMRRKIAEIAARWYVFFFLNFYGIGKIIGGQFYQRGSLPEDVASTTLGDATGFDLAWTFMGFSFVYILFIGLAEIVGAWLLLWERTKLLGAAILLPIMVNILVFDVAFLDEYGALASATIYTLLLCAIFYLNKERVLRALQALIPDAGSRWAPKGQRVKIAIAALVAIGLLLALDQMLVNLLGYGKG